VNVADLNVTIVDEPASNYLLVLKFVTARQSDILLTDENREKPECGLVLKVGPGGVGAESGREVPVLSRVGQLAWFGKYAGLDFEVQGPKGPVPVLLVRDSEVLLRREPGAFEVEVHDDDLRKAHLKGLLCEHCPQQKSALIEEERQRLLREREQGALVVEG